MSTHAPARHETSATGGAMAGAPEPADPVVELAGVHYRFGSGKGLVGLGLSVPPASITVLVGPNGAGKTTALRVITGALRPDSGSVRVFGIEPGGPDGERVRQRCGVVAAKPALYDRLTGRDNLRFAAQLFGMGRDAPVDAAAARFGIDRSLDLRVAGYSTGMKTRLALARAVLHEPELLLLDEPTSGLDPESSHTVLELIRNLAAGGTTVVMSTHLLLEAEGLADQVVIMEDGVDVLAGSTTELMHRFWPRSIVRFGAEEPAGLDRLAGMDGVLAYGREDGVATVELDDPHRVPGLVAALTAAGVRLTLVRPHEPSLEELYLRVRRRTLP
jgi:ABC-2 type transport system ATP-binding protein